MAIHAPITGAPTRAPAIAFHVLPRRVRRLLATVDRDEIGEAIEVLVARLDQIDGDADLEETFDEDGNAPWWAQGSGAGCPISDPGGCEHDGREPEDSH